MMGEILPGKFYYIYTIEYERSKPYDCLKIFYSIFSENQRHGSFVGDGFQLGLHVRRHQNVFRFITSLRCRRCFLVFRRYVLIGIDVCHILRARNSRQESRRYRTEFNWCRQGSGETSKKNEFHSAFETASNGDIKKKKKNYTKTEQYNKFSSEPLRHNIYKTNTFSAKKFYYDVPQISPMYINVFNNFQLNVFNHFLNALDTTLF